MKIDNVPVIDMREINEQQTRCLIDFACRKWGFFHVIGHDIDSSEIAALQDQMRRFFAQASVEKRAIMRTLDNPWGFYDQELTKNTRDWKEVFDFGPAFNADAAGDVMMAPRWPANMPAFRAAIETYYQSCERVAFRLLGAISNNLGMPGGHLSQWFTGNHSSFLRLNYYPVCPDPETPSGATEPVKGHLGLNRHTDAGALTLLLQDRQPGLQVFKDGRWLPVSPIEGALTVNIGDIVQVWSNDQYPAAVHRVLANPSAERFSVPFFFNPRYDTHYRPLPSTVDLHRPQRYSDINWGEFRRLRAEGDYADCGEEIQISHYRTGESQDGLYRYHCRR